MNELEAKQQFKKLPKDIQKLIVEDLKEAFVHRVSTFLEVEGL